MNIGCNYEMDRHTELVKNYWYIVASGESLQIGEYSSVSQGYLVNVCKGIPKSIIFMVEYSLE